MDFSFNIFSVLSIVLPEIQITYLNKFSVMFLGINIPTAVICLLLLFSFTEKHDETKRKTNKLKELCKYLVHILKHELGVNDLEEKAVIHSISIKENFTEPRIKNLQSLKSINDYSRLDMALIYALLRNFCDNIKPSSRGWDYEPPDDEIHVGADIERIRFMWNKYCDDDLEFELDEVYNRIKQTYGTVIYSRNDASQHPNIDEENTDGSEWAKEKIPGTYILLHSKLLILHLRSVSKICKI